MPRRSFRPGVREEFSTCLKDTTLDSNDVRGIRKVNIDCRFPFAAMMMCTACLYFTLILFSPLIYTKMPIQLAESAHICQELLSGPYRGLNQNESAVRVAATIHGENSFSLDK